MPEVQQINILYLMGLPGFEPGTNRLKAEYSTVELGTQDCVFHTLIIVTQILRKFKAFYKFTVMVIVADVLECGANTVRCSPVLSALRGALQGSRQ